MITPLEEDDVQVAPENYDKDIQRLEQRLESIQTNYATLHDVDRRFAEDRARIQSLESKQIDNNRMYIEIVDRINSTFDMKLASNLKPLTEQINKLDSKIDTVEEKVDHVKEKSSDSTSLTLRYIVSVIVSFVLGSGAIGAIQYFESVIRK